jgi:hypothetical protein
MAKASFLLLMLCGGCIAGGTVVVHGDQGAPDNHVMRQVMRQDMWAQQAVDSRPNARQLERIRSGRDQASMDRARKELTKLLQAIDRGTWIRDTVADLMREDNDPRLAQEFDRAGHLRADAARSAGELAEALIDGGANLSPNDLRPGVDALRKAQASEDRIARIPVGPQYPRLAPSPLPSPSPLDRPMAKLNGGGAAPPMVTVQQTPNTQPNPSIDNTRNNGTAGGLPPMTDPAPPAGADSWGTPTGNEAQGPQSTLTIQNDALEIITRKRPKSITLREDGLFDLSCADGEYLVSPDGKLVRTEPAQP